MSMSQTVAGNIRAEAARAGITQTEVARELHMAQQNVSKRWRGERPWRLDEVERVAHMIGVNVYDLLRARRDSNPQPSDPEAGHLLAFPAFPEQEMLPIAA